MKEAKTADCRIEMTAQEYDVFFWDMVKHQATLVAGNHEGTTLILEVRDEKAPKVDLHLCHADGQHWLNLVHH